MKKNSIIKQVVTFLVVFTIVFTGVSLLSSKNLRGFTYTVFAGEVTKELDVNVNFLDFYDYRPSFKTKGIVVDDRVLLPIRDVMEAFDYTVSWDDTLKATILKKDNIEITIKADSNEMEVSMEGLVTFTKDLGGAPVNYNSNNYYYLENLLGLIGYKMSYIEGRQNVLDTILIDMYKISKDNLITEDMSDEEVKFKTALLVDETRKQEELNRTLEEMEYYQQTKNKEKEPQGFTKSQERMIRNIFVPIATAIVLFFLRKRNRDN